MGFGWHKEIINMWLIILVVAITIITIGIVWQAFYPDESFSNFLDHSDLISVIIFVGGLICYYIYNNTNTDKEQQTIYQTINKPVKENEIDQNKSNAMFEKKTDAEISETRDEYVESYSHNNYQFNNYQMTYNEFDENYTKEYERSEQRDPHKWENEDIEGFYVLLDGVTDSDEADYIASEYYDGEYIYECGDYYAKTSDVRSGEYKIELGQRINSKLFEIRGTDLYIHFKWITSLYRGAEGMVDIFAGRGTFYVKPDNLR